MVKDLKKIMGRIACGSFVGLANGLFGGGGGMLAVPLLEKLGFSEKQAHATAILIILPVSALSFFLYAVRGLYDFSVLIPTAIGVTAGGFLGAKLLTKISSLSVTLTFAFLQLLAGVWLTLSR